MASYMLLNEAQSEPVEGEARHSWRITRLK
ncbi:hypothetical protein R1CP_21335 [Rhodococcus opacus]|uniref:Uncharacterized protein n=1 Tax=Rhodococcus opacus TaxID=37919 RepID=A0A1B1K8H8_RHOOP|nr:hypothetical protein R1CP_21335 [Rhodococcus opacus]